MPTIAGSLPLHEPLDVIPSAEWNLILYKINYGSNTVNSSGFLVGSVTVVDNDRFGSFVGVNLQNQDSSTIGSHTVFGSANDIYWKDNVGSLTSLTQGGAATGDAVVLTSQSIDASAGVGSLVCIDATAGSWINCGSGITPTGMMSDTSEVTLFGKVSGLAGIGLGSLYWQDSAGNGISTTNNTDVKVGVGLSTSELLLDIDVEGTGSSSFSPVSGEPAGGDFIVSHATLGSGLIGFWESNESEHFPDSSGSGLTGIINGPIFTASGFFEGAYDYDGTDDYVDIGDPAIGTSNTGAIVMWFNADSTSNSFLIGDSNGTSANIALSIEILSGVIATQIGNGATFQQDSHSTSLSTGQWYFVAASVDGTDITIQVNGTRETFTQSIQMQQHNNSFNYSIGKLGTVGGYFNGKIDEIGMWDRALTNSELDDLYNSGSGLQFDDVNTDTLSGNATLPTDIVAYWDSDTDGVFTDNTGNGHTGTINGATFTSSGRLAGAYDYDGTNDYVEVADADAFSFTDGAGTDEAFSISVWVKHDAFSNNAVITKQDQGTDNREWTLTHVDLSGKGQIIFVIYTDNTNFIGIQTTTGVLSTGQWHHVIATYDGSETNGGMNIYVDGVLQTVSNTNGGTHTGMSNTAQPVMIGAKDLSGTPATFMDGIMDEIGVWNKELTAQERSDLYNLGRGLPYD